MDRRHRRIQCRHRGRCGVSAFDRPDQHPQAQEAVMTRRKSSEPACRVCGCTEHNACDEGSSWVSTERGSPPLCSACSGGAGDMEEAIKRGVTFLRRPGIAAANEAVAIGRAAIRRRNARVKAERRNPDPAWGGR
jgi:hypothetical protein